MYARIHVKHPSFLSDFSKILISSPDFQKILKYQISQNCIPYEPSSSMRAERHEEESLVRILRKRLKKKWN
jgi:hypothetical protein